MANKVTRTFRKSSFMIEKNTDLFYFILSLVGAIVLGFLLCLLAVSFASYIETPLEGGLKTFITTLVAIITEAIVIYKKLCSPAGDITQKLQAGVAKKYDTETFNTIVDGG